MAVSDAVIELLVDKGIGTVFGIPGTQTLPLNKAIEATDELDYIMARHETAVSHQAWGYGQTSDEMAATLVVPGPGDMNAMNGLKNALNDCTPLLHLSIETDPEIRGGDGIHETPHNTYDNVVKENILVETPESTVAAVAEGIAIARTPPTGPVRVGIPRSFLSLDTERATAFGNREGETAPPLPTTAAEKLAERLATSTSPAIIAGGGIRIANATRELKTVAETLSAPVFVTTKGKGVFPEDHPLFAGVIWGGASAAVRDELASSDTTFAVGSDLDTVTTNEWSFDLPNLLHVTLDRDDVGGSRNGYDPQFSLLADAKAVLKYVGDALENKNNGGATRAEKVRTAEAATIEPLREADETPLNSVAALDVIRETAPRETVVTADAGGSRLWTVVTFDVYDPRSYVNPGSWASMGTGLPAAIGAKVANPDRPVVSLIGDGGLMMCLHELHTAVAENVGVVTVVFNNSDYAIISDGATSEFGVREQAYGWEESPIDFTTVAEGLGIESFAATTREEISSAMTDALSRDRPTLVEIMTDPLEPQTAEWMRDQ